MFHAHKRLILCTPDLARRLHMDCAWVAHARLILWRNCARTADFVDRVPTDDGFWLRIEERGLILCIDCGRQVDFVNGLRREGWFCERIAHGGFCVCECSLRCNRVGEFCCFALLGWICLMLYECWIIRVSIMLVRESTSTQLWLTKWSFGCWEDFNK